MRALEPRQTVFQPVPAQKDIERTLGFHEYTTKKRTIDLTSMEHPCFASLGACENFTDELLAWAYDRQRDCDPENRPFYFDCLKHLATGRDSSDLQTKVAMAQSSGEVGLADIKDAYKFLGLEINTTEGDDHVIGTFKSRIQSAPRQKDEAKEKLHIIAKHRGSAEIEKVASDKRMSYDEALELLGVSADTPDDSVEASAVALVSHRLCVFLWPCEPPRSTICCSLLILFHLELHTYII